MAGGGVGGWAVSAIRAVCHAVNFAQSNTVLHPPVYFITGVSISSRKSQYFPAQTQCIRKPGNGYKCVA